VTLPGFDAYPDPAPAKTAFGYLPWLHEQDYPDDWRFWALAGSCERKTTPSIEYVFLVRGGLVREALIDLDELRVIQWVTR